MKITHQSTFEDTQKIRAGIHITIELHGRVNEGVVDHVKYSYESIGHLYFHTYLLTFTDGKKSFFRTLAS